ncbi:orc1/cdc6 family replication initiation protein [Halobacteria archaeon AArc-m2/3/4]|uniref:ORC1-type DNA replication protein n=1 Tax=Natronoglomus mannanivorans TaxID=2979990 RepID=A0AAP2Z473_9EURY|nr:orc1/cdc6 family replication initiation protein [Halobacteria archaeon AArc-xg1-1]MCU4974638.1 orc1/cdc6 family replication initiation protein [Halobacteria archaeon AArc-m2/3/4]
MSGPFSDLTETLFADKSVLSESYHPEEILERDEEIEEYRYALQDILFGRDPENVMLYGKAGLGKTAVTKYMTDALREEVASREEADDLFVHEVNCNGKTLFMVVRRLVNELLPEDASQFPKRGLGTGDAFDELYRQLDRLGGTHLIVFDEIDHLDDVNTLLYELPRARSNGHLETSRIGIIGISNNYTFRNSLSSKVKDTLMETEISFSPYDAGELRTILYDRADRAFVDGAYDKSAITMAAALAAQDMGNARQAIDLLRVGAEVAEKAGDTRVVDDHIENARTLVQRGRLRNRIRDQTQHAQYILETVAHLENRGQTPVRSKTIRANYEDVATSWASEPLTTLKSIQDHLAELHMLGFLRRTEKNHGLSGGHYYEYELDLEPGVVLETRETIEGEEQTV